MVADHQGGWDQARVTATAAVCYYYNSKLLNMDAGKSLFLCFNVFEST